VCRILSLTARFVFFLFFNHPRLRTSAIVAKVAFAWSTIDRLETSFRSQVAARCALAKRELLFQFTILLAFACLFACDCCCELRGCVCDVLCVMCVCVVVRCVVSGGGV
jgi:hypothetical protein